MAIARRAQPDLTAVTASELHALAVAGRRLPSLSRAPARLAGNTELSRFRGRGVEYDESRHYQPGDSIRHLDARVTARRGEPFTKIYREDRERPVFLCVDDRASMQFATRGRFKRVIAAQVAAVIAGKAFHEGGRVGALVWRGQYPERFSARRGRGSLALLMQALSAPARWQSAADEQLVASLRATVTLLPREVPTGALLIILSDFRGLDDAAHTQLVGLRRRCDVLLGKVHDALEYTLPQSRGRYPVANALGRITLFGGDARAQARFEAAAAERDARLGALARALRARLMPLATDCDPIRECHRVLGGRS